MSICYNTHYWNEYLLTIQWSLIFLVTETLQETTTNNVMVNEFTLQSLITEYLYLHNKNNFLCQPLTKYKLNAKLYFGILCQHS